MKDNLAENFYEITDALRLNENLLESVKQLIKTKDIVGKSLEGGNRKTKFKEILIELAEGKITLNESFLLVGKNISENESVYRGNKRVFSVGWPERLVRTNLSKFYNQAILLEVLKNGETRCFIPHSKNEKLDSPCTSASGKEHNALEILTRLIRSYEDGIFSKELKIPDHPYCTHVVIPIK